MQTSESFAKAIERAGSMGEKRKAKHFDAIAATEFEGRMSPQN